MAQIHHIHESGDVTASRHESMLPCRRSCGKSRPRTIRRFEKPPIRIPERKEISFSTTCDQNTDKESRSLDDSFVDKVLSGLELCNSVSGTSQTSDSSNPHKLVLKETNGNGPTQDRVHMASRKFHRLLSRIKENEVPSEASNQQPHLSKTANQANDSEAGKQSWSLSRTIWPSHTPEDPKQFIHTELSFQNILTNIHSGSLCSAQEFESQSHQNHLTSESWRLSKEIWPRNQGPSMDTQQSHLAPPGKDLLVSNTMQLSQKNITDEFGEKAYKNCLDIDVGSPGNEAKQSLRTPTIPNASQERSKNDLQLLIREQDTLMKDEAALKTRKMNMMLQKLRTLTPRAAVGNS